MRVMSQAAVKVLKCCSTTAGKEKNKAQNYINQSWVFFFFFVLRRFRLLELNENKTRIRVSNRAEISEN